MALLDSTYALLDYMAVRTGIDNATARAENLKFLQMSEETLWFAGPWEFREEQVGLELKEAENEYALEGSTADVIRFFNSDGVLIPQLRVHTFLANFRSSGASGQILVWCKLPREEAAQLVKIRVWPTPIAGKLSTLIHRITHPATLVDDSANFSRFPQTYRTLIVIDALRRRCRHEHLSDLAQMFDQELKELIAKLGQKEQEFMRGYM